MPPRLVPAATQALLLLMSVLVPLVLPMLAGLAFYGEFVRASAATFLLIKLFEIPMEGSQRLADDRRMLSACGTLAMISLACGVVWNLIDPRRAVDLPLLVAGLASMAMTTFVGARRSSKEFLAFVAVFVGGYLIVFAAIVARSITPVLGLTIVNLTALLWLPRVLRTEPLRASAAAGAVGTPARPGMTASLRMLLWGIATGTFPAFLQLGVPALHGARADARALGEVRLAASVLGMAALLLPIPLKALAPALLERGTSFARLGRFIAAALLSTMVGGVVVLAWAVTVQHPRAPMALVVPLGALVMLYLTCERGLIVFAGSRMHGIASIVATGAGALAMLAAQRMPLQLQFITAAAAGIGVYLAACRSRLVVADRRWSRLIDLGIGSAVLLLVAALALALVISERAPVR